MPEKVNAVAVSPRTLYHSFRDLLENWPGTAAKAIPLLMWQDTVTLPGRQVTNHHRDFCSLYIVRRGRGFHVIDGVRYAIARGDVYAMGPGMSHYFEGCDSLTTDTFHFSPAVFDRDTLDALAETPGFHSLFVTEPLGRRAPLGARGSGGGASAGLQERWLHLTPTQYAATQAAIAELRAEWTRGRAPAGALLTRALFFRLLVHLSRFYAENVGGATAIPAPAGFAGAHEATIASAVRYLEEHFSEPLRIEQVAALVFLSPDRFTEVFAQAMGRTPRDYLRHLRVEHAKMLLTTTDHPMSAIAEASGFTEPAYFTRVLRAATGVPPTEFRRRAAPK